MTISTAQVSVIGCGYWGKNLVRNFHALGALGMVCDATDAGRGRATDLAPGIPVVEDADAVFASDAPGVVLATPAETHFDLARQALLAGKDVFVEKPLALTFEQGTHLVDLSRQRERILMVGHVLEYHPGIVALYDLVQRGALGRLQYIYSNRLSLGIIRRKENILWSFAPHDIAVILRLVGALPFDVVCCGGAYVQANIADVTLTNLLFDNGVRAHIHVSWLHPFKEQRLVVIGDRKMAVFDDVARHLLLYDQRVEWQEGQPVPVRHDGARVAYADEEPLRRECQAFLDAIEQRKSPLTDGLSGLRVLRVLQAAQRSLVMNGEPVHLPMDRYDRLM